MALTLARRTTLMPPSAVREILKVAENPAILSFAGGLPARDLFPVDAIAEAHNWVLTHDAALTLQYSTTEGFVPLREWIVARLTSQGIKATVDGTIITSGSQQGIDLAARVLLDPGDVVAVESPTYLSALQVFNGYEARFATIGSDDEGMKVDELETALAAQKIKMIYLVVNFQNPKGTTLSEERRHKLVALAARYNVPVIEDDPYGELRFEGRDLPALQALDEAGVVIRLGSFSKVLAPGLRIGFCTGPREVLRAMTIAKQASDLHTGTIAQRAAGKLLETFDFEGHMSRLRAVYGERAKAMLVALEKHMPAVCKWTHPEGGMFVWFTLPDGMDSQTLLPKALEHKVAFVPGHQFFAGTPPTRYMRLNYSSCTPEQIDEGMRRLGEVVHEAVAAHGA